MNKLQQYERRLLDDANEAGTENNTNDGTRRKSDASLDEILEHLEDDDEFMHNYREERLQQIADDMRKVKENVRTENYGLLTIVEEEREVIRLTTKTDQVVIHFGLDDFRKCQTMDAKLSQLAQRHLMTRFLRASVDKCPFLVAKLQIKVLPFVVAYKNGVERTRVVGFSRLGNQPDDFDIAALENVFYEAGVLAKKSTPWRPSAGGRDGSDDSDLDV
ncbi:LADA_0C01200g1_1 [Lachancea dasiensis]|uniref:LADA_0C01200g1_1 n=1 Tax=Lachancea dasiensis TaxID=1072105 RepID=A0A1G4IXF6_9SACH|nr:LADA_0C01200g1_1 [Lachancea dasiensis]